MATVYTDIATEENTPGGPATALDPQKTKGKVRVVQAIYTAASLATASIINVCKLRKGDMVLPNSFIMHADLGSGTAIILGDNDATADDNRYLEATEPSPAGVIQLNDTATVIANIPFKVTTDCWLQCKTTGETTGRILFYIFIAPAGA